MKHFAIALSMLALASCSTMSDNDEITITDNLVNVGDPLPTFSISMSDGSTLTTSDLKGKPSLIVFFSTSCPDCQRELPLLNERYLAHGNDTTFVAISREQGLESVSSYWQLHGLSIPFSAQSDRAVYSLFAKKGIPRTYISDSHCVVTAISGPLQ